MAIRLNVGLSKKVGQPDYGSLGASCHVEFELGRSTLEDLDDFRRQVRRAFVACGQAVGDELARQRSGPGGGGDAAGGDDRPGPGGNGHGGNGHGHGGPPHRAKRAASESQCRALHAIAGRRRVDLAALLRKRFGVGRAEDLGLREASGLIDELKGSRRDLSCAAAPR